MQTLESLRDEWWWRNCWEMWADGAPENPDLWREGNNHHSYNFYFSVDVHPPWSLLIWLVVQVTKEGLKSFGWTPQLLQHLTLLLIDILQDRHEDTSHKAFRFFQNLLDTHRKERGSYSYKVKKTLCHLTCLDQDLPLHCTMPFPSHEASLPG